MATASATTAHADTVIATEARATGVSAHGDRLAWSSYDPTSRRYRLVSRTDGVTRTVPVRSRRVPFDVDLGPDRAGRTVAVYSRCRREPSFENTANQLPTYGSGRGCDIYEFDFARGRERKLTRVSGRHSSEVLPSVWGRRIAFIRVYERRRGDAGHVRHLYVADGRSREIRGGPRGSPGPLSLDLAGRRVAYAWAHTPRSQCQSPANRVPLFKYETVMVSITGSRLRLRAGCQPRDQLSPVFFAGSVVHYTTRTVGEESVSFFERVAPRSGRREQARAPDSVISMAHAETGIVYAEFGLNMTRIVQSDTAP